MQIWTNRGRRLRRTKQQLRQSRPTRLRLEPLEARLLLAQVTALEQQYRQDDFSTSGSYTYLLQQPYTGGEYSGYRNKIDNGSYTSTSGHISWTSPKDGTGFFQGQATEAGSTGIYNYATWYDMSTYTVSETGRFDFTVDAAKPQAQLTMTGVTSLSTGFLAYNNIRSSPQPDTAPAYFFGGSKNLYSGTFSSANHTVSISYADPDSNTTASAPPAALQWTASTATDLELKVSPLQPSMTIPSGWTSIPQATPPLMAVDVAQGGVEFTVAVHGRPLTTSTPSDAVARVRFYWASSATDTTGSEIPVTSTSGPLGVYWNSSQLHAIVNQFPTPPTGANYVRVVVDGAAATDANLGNNTAFLRIDRPADSGTSGPTNEDALFDQRASSVLTPQDLTNPNLKVYAYNPASDMGAIVQIVDAAGGYVYNPQNAASIQALAQGETANDVIRFIKYGTMYSQGTRTIQLVGVNDPPVAQPETASGTNYQTLSWTAASLLANDTDIDHGDSLTIKSVVATSTRGATLQTVLNPAHTQIEQVVYNPASSDQLRNLLAGQQVTDSFEYVVSDAWGATVIDRVQVTVTGESPITISQVLPQATTSDQPLGPIQIQLTSPGVDPGVLQLTAQATAPSVIPAASLQLSGTGATRQLVITPVVGTTGPTQIIVQAADGRGRTAVMSFPLVVGLPDDLDLDGVPNVVEDAAPHGGDMNSDGTLDSHQANLASVQIPGSTAYLNLAVSQSQFLAHVAIGDSPAPSGPAANAQFPVGLLHFEVLGAGSGTTSTATLRTDFSAAYLNRYFQYNDPATGGQGWRTLMYDGVAGARIFADRIEVAMQEGGRGDQGTSGDGKILCTAALAQVAHPWQNDQKSDVNNDGFVTPLDALILIDGLNRNGGVTLGPVPVGQDSLPYFLDPTGDDHSTPLDVLQIITALNGAGSAGEGEAAVLTASPEPAAGVSLSGPVRRDVWRAPRPVATLPPGPLTAPSREIHDPGDCGDAIATDAVFAELGTGSWNSRFRRHSRSVEASRHLGDSDPIVPEGAVPRL